MLNQRQSLEIRVKQQLIESMRNCGIIFNLSDQPEDIRNQDLNAEQAAEMIASEYLHEYEEAGNIEIFAAVGKYLGDMDREFSGYFMEIPKSNSTLVLVYRGFNIHVMTGENGGKLSIWHGTDHIGNAPNTEAAKKFIDVTLMDHPELDPDDSEYRPELDEVNYPNKDQADFPAPAIDTYARIELGSVDGSSSFRPEQWSGYYKRFNMADEGQIEHDEVYGIDQAKAHINELREAEGGSDDDRKYWENRSFAIRRITTTTELIEVIGPGNSPAPAIDPIPEAACKRCGGWTSFGGCSQYSKSLIPIEGRIGCICNRMLGRRLYEHIERALKTSGSYDPDQNLYLIEEQLTMGDIDLIRGFLNWLFLNGRTIGSGNYEQEFRSFMESANPIRIIRIDPSDVPCMGCGRIGCDESGECVR